MIPLAVAQPSQAEIGPGLGGVLFDLDGTLADTHAALRRAYDRFLQRHGHRGTDEEFERYAGPPLAEIVAGLAGTHQLPRPLVELLDEYVVEVRAAYLQAPLFAGVLAILDELDARGIAMAVVTSAPASLARALLEARGVLGRFRAVVCGDEVARGKPHPDGYREALHRLGLDPGRAVAVEDTPSGIAAAQAAGLRCIAVSRADAGIKMARAGATLTAADIDEAARMIRSLCRGTDHVTPATILAVRRRGAMPPLDEKTAARVDAIWAHAVADRPGLFDGRMLVVAGRRTIAGGLAIDVVEAPYRWFFAQRRGIALGLRPLGVTGVTELAPLRGSPNSGLFLVGRRGPAVTQNPGCWELVPSGGVSADHLLDDGTIDLEAQLEEELEEELGVGPERIVSMKPLGLIESVSEGVVDAAFRVTVRATQEELQRGIARTNEYTALEMRSIDQLREGMKRKAEAWVSSAAPLLDLLEGQREGRRAGDGR